MSTDKEKRTFPAKTKCANQDNKNIPCDSEECNSVEIKTVGFLPAKNGSKVYRRLEGALIQVVLREPMPSFGVFVNGIQTVVFSFWEVVDACRFGHTNPNIVPPSGFTIEQFYLFKSAIEEIEKSMSEIFSNIIESYRQTEEFSLLSKSDPLKKYISKLEKYDENC